MHSRLSHTLCKLLAGIVIATVLATVFLAYLQPGFVVDLANRIMLCF